MNHISLYVDCDSFLTRLHPLTKLSYILTAVIGSLISGSLYVYGIFIIISLLLLCKGRVIKKALWLLTFSLGILLTIFLIHGLFHKGNSTELFRVGKLIFYEEGIAFAIRIGANILNLLLSFAVFVLSTKPSDFVEELEQRGLPSRIGYMITSVFQIVPQMMTRKKTILEAQKSRGLQTEGSLPIRIKAFFPLLVPVVTGALMDTRERAAALEVRGFSVRTKRSFLNHRVFQKIDKAILLGCLLVLSSIIVGRIFYAVY